MLIIMRKKEGAIWLYTEGGRIRVKVLETKRGRVKLGITAPKNVTILREELLPDGEHTKG